MADIGRSGWRNSGSSIPWPARLVAIAATQRSAISSSVAPSRSGAAQVGLLAGEQAVADLSVGGQPDPVAVTTERPGHRGDHAHGRRATVDEEQLGGGAPPRLGRRGQHELLLQAGEDLVGRHHLHAAPAVLGVQRHLLDEAQVVAVVEAPAQQLWALLVVEAAQQHRVDLDRAEARLRGGREAFDDVVQPVAPRDGVERLGADAVEADVDAVEARLLERVGGAGEPQRVGGHRDLEVGRDGAGAGHDVDQPAADERLTAGEAHLADPQQPDPDVDQTDDLGVGEDALVGQPLQPLGGHAVGTAQVAAVGQRDPEVGRDPAEAVAQGAWHPTSLGGDRLAPLS